MDTRTLYSILCRDHIILVICWVSYYIQLYRLIGNMHVLESFRMPEFELDIKHSFKGFTSDNGVLYGRRRTVETHAFKIIRKTWQSWIKFEAKVTRSFFAFCLHVQTLLWQITNFMSASSVYVWESNVSYCESSSSFVLVLSPLNTLWKDGPNQ